MAFFCPVRLRKGKKRRARRHSDTPMPGRITGSASIDTLHRIELEKQNLDLPNRTKMLVTHDFVPCVDDELSVEKGQQVAVLYQENDWLYVIADNGQEGFVPYTYCMPLSSPATSRGPSYRDSDSSYYTHGMLKRSTSTPSLQQAMMSQGQGALAQHRHNGPPHPNLQPGVHRNPPPQHINNQSQSNDRPTSMTVGYPQNSKPTTPYAGFVHAAQVHHSSTKPGVNNNRNSSSSSSNHGHQPVLNLSFSQNTTNDKQLLQHMKNIQNGVRQFNYRSQSLDRGMRTQSLDRNTRTPKSLTSTPRMPVPPQQRGRPLSRGNGVPERGRPSSRNGERRCMSPVELEQDQFLKKTFGRFIVLFKFIGQEENDISVERGEFVSVLNKDDKDWFWVARSDYEEGFVPSSFLCPAEGQELDAQMLPPTGTPINATQARHGRNISKLICAYDFKGQSGDDLTVVKGDIIYADLGTQYEEGWLWAYTKDKRQGYLPRAYIKEPPPYHEARGRHRPGDPFMSP